MLVSFVDAPVSTTTAWPEGSAPRRLACVRPPNAPQSFHAGLPGAGVGLYPDPSHASAKPAPGTGPPPPRPPAPPDEEPFPSAAAPPPPSADGPPVSEASQPTAVSH